MIAWLEFVAAVVFFASIAASFWVDLECWMRGEE